MRITKSTEAPGGNLTDAMVRTMREINTAPTFDRKSKQWTLVKIPKSTTRNVAWHIRIDEVNYLAIQAFSGSECVVFYSADAKGKLVGSYSNAVKRYSTYVDLEAAVDLFYEELQAEKQHEETTVSTGEPGN